MAGAASACSWLEGHVLVRAEESHELWHLDDLNLSSPVNVEVSPGLGEVGVEVVLEISSGLALMGLEDLSRGSSGGGFVEPEVSGWGSVLVLLLESVLLDHGSHEDVVRIGGESGWGDSIVSALSGHLVLSWDEEFTGVIDLLVVTSELNETVIS